MTRYIEIRKQVPVFDSLPDDLKLTVEDIYAYFDQFPNDPRKRLAHEIQPLIARLNADGGCIVATKWPRVSNRGGAIKWGRCRQLVMPGEDLCYLHGGSDPTAFKKEQSRVKRIARLKAELAQLERGD